MAYHTGWCNVQNVCLKFEISSSLLKFIFGCRALRWKRIPVDVSKKNRHKFNSIALLYALLSNSFWCRVFTVCYWIRMAVGALIKKLFEEFKCKNSPFWAFFWWIHPLAEKVYETLKNDQKIILKIKIKINVQRKSIKRNNSSRFKISMT